MASTKVEVVRLPRERRYQGARLSPPGVMIRLNREAALRLIESLASQLVRCDPNTNRWETDAIDGGYFSVSVNDEAFTEEARNAR